MMMALMSHVVNNANADMYDMGSRIMGYGTVLTSTSTVPYVFVSVLQMNESKYLGKFPDDIPP
jgi:hypothetical protein